MSQRSILTVTLNPALDISAEIDNLLAEAKMRCREPRYEPGGGGVNVARVIREFGGDVSAFIAIAGPTGRWLEDILSKAGIEVFAHEVGGTTRPSFHITEKSTGQLYRFVLPGLEISGENAEQIEIELAALVSRLRPNYLVASGSVPSGVSADLLPRLAKQCRAEGIRFIADTSGPSLAALVGAGAFLLKPGEDELEELRSALGWQPALAEATARRLIEEGTSEIVVATLGGEGAVLVTPDVVLRLPALPVQPLSAVGAGDSFVAGLVLALARGETLDLAFRHGMAAGAAAVVTPGSALALRDDYERLLRLDG